MSKEFMETKLFQNFAQGITVLICEDNPMNQAVIRVRHE